MWWWIACGEPTERHSEVPESDTGTAPTDSVPVTDTSTAPVTVGISALAWSLDERVGSVVRVSWTQDQPATAHVAYSVDEGLWRTSPPFAAEAGAQEQVLVGLPFGAEVAWEVVAGASTADGEPIHTARGPAALPLPEVEIAGEETELGGPFLLTSIKQEGSGWDVGTFWIVILDRRGRVVWTLRSPDRTLFPQVSVTGDYLLWDQATYWSIFDGGEGSTVHYTWLDREFDEVATPGVHHPFVQHPDGTLAWTSRIHGGGEAVVEKAPGQQDETVVWSCDEDWPEGAGYNCHNNGMYYRAATETYLLSFPLWSSVVEVSRAHETLWYAGAWISGGYDFDPYNFAFTWEHGVSFTDEGNVLLSGNLFYTTWCHEYEVDSAAQTLRYVWGSDSGVLLSNSGQCWRRPDGHTSHVVGDSGVIREADEEGNDVWRLSYPNRNLLGQGELIDDLYALVEPR